MKATNRSFSIEESDARMQEILELADASFVEAEQIPSPERLTYDNGFYVECAALFIDIRGSSQLTSKHTPAVLGKIYRAYISECVAILNQDPNCGEIFIQGDCVGAVFHAPRDEDVDSVFVRAGELNSLITHLNWRLGQRGYSPLKCGIGMSTGRALMIQAGFKGSSINEVIWMGDVVNEAAKLCHLGNRDENSPAHVSRRAFLRLSAQNKKHLAKIRPTFLGPSHYQGNFVSTEIATWTGAKRGDKKSGWTTFFAPAGDSGDREPLRSVSSWE